MSIMEQIGGEDAVNVAVDIFYQKVLADDTINHFFDDTDMDAQRGKQKKFLRLLLSGKADDADAYMRKAHAPLVEKGLNDEHFNAVAGHLQSTLAELGVPAEILDQIMAAAAGLKDAILNR